MTEQTQIKIEQYLLSLLLKNKKLIYKIPNCFVSDTAKDIYKAIKSTAERDMELTIPNVVLEASKFDPSLNEEKLSILSQVEASEEDISAYMSDLKRLIFDNQKKQKEQEEDIETRLNWRNALIGSVGLPSWVKEEK